MAGSEIFKTTFKGYCKDEVIQYIDKLNFKLTFLQEELNSTSARLVQAEEQLREEAESNTQSEVAEEEYRNKIAEEITAELTEKLRIELSAELRDEIEKEARRKFEEELAAKYEEIARNEINNRVNQQNSEIDELRRKAELYDSDREVLAELMIKAKKDAASIIQDAEEHALKLREEADQRFNLLIADYEMLKDNLIRSKDDAVDRLLGAVKSLDNFEKAVLSMDQDIVMSKSHLDD